MVHAACKSNAVCPVIASAVAAYREFVLLRFPLSLTASLSYLPPTFQNAEDRLGKHDVAVFPKLLSLIIIPTGALVLCFAAFEDITHTVKPWAIERNARNPAIAQHGAPEYVRSDNGSEFIARIVQRWLKENGIKTIYIEPGSPWQNGFVESFHGRFRDECLNREQLWTLTEARVVIENDRRDYNEERPHSRLGYESPAQYATRLCPSPAPVGLRPPSTGDGQAENKQLTSNQSLD